MKSAFLTGARAYAAWLDVEQQVRDRINADAMEFAALWPHFDGTRENTALHFAEFMGMEESMVHECALIISEFIGGAPQPSMLYTIRRQRRAA